MSDFISVQIIDDSDEEIEVPKKVIKKVLKKDLKCSMKVAI